MIEPSRTRVIPDFGMKFCEVTARLPGNKSLRDRSKQILQILPGHDTKYFKITIVLVLYTPIS